MFQAGLRSRCTTHVMDMASSSLQGAGCLRADALLHKAVRWSPSMRRTLLHPPRVHRPGAACPHPALLHPQRKGLDPQGLGIFTG